MSGDAAIVELLRRDYAFFVMAMGIPNLHPCAVGQLHTDYAIASDYASLIACVRYSTLDDARRVIEVYGQFFTDTEALTHAKASVLTIISIHGRKTT